MSLLQDKSIPRRSFLIGALGAAGAAVVAFLPSKSYAAALKQTGLVASPPSVGFWDKDRIVATNRLVGGGNSLYNAKVSLQGFNGLGSIRAIDANFNVSGPGGMQVVPFQAWTASATMNTLTQFTINVQNGLSLTVYEGVNGASSTVELSPTTLREGAYVIAPSTVDLSQFALDLDNTQQPLKRISGVGGPVAYVVLTVESY